MNEYLKIMGWKNHDGSWNWKEIGIDALVLAGVTVAIISISKVVE